MLYDVTEKSSCKWVRVWVFDGTAFKSDIFVAFIGFYR